MRNLKQTVFNLIKKKKRFRLKDISAELKKQNLSWLNPDMSLKDYLDDFVENDILSYNKYTLEYKL